MKLGCSSWSYHAAFRGGRAEGLLVQLEEARYPVLEQLVQLAPGGRAQRRAQRRARGLPRCLTLPVAARGERFHSARDLGGATRGIGKESRHLVELVESFLIER